METVETIIIGGGQAGLATSFHLSHHNRDHILFEQETQAGSVWQNGRWDSFTLVTPNWALRLPGAEYNGANRNGFLAKGQIVQYFEQYIRRFQLPIQYNTRAITIEPLEHKGYRVQTNRGAWQAKNVVIATGYEQNPRIPAYAANIPTRITQLHSSGYRNPSLLPEGAVLVVGSAQSGCQIAEELYQSGRKVYLCTSSAGRVPRTYRGKDIFEWLFLSGFFDLTAEKFPFPKGHFTPPHLTGKNGGHTINLNQFSRDGVNLLGHIHGVSGDKVFFAPDLYENLAKADQLEQRILKMIDGYIQGKGLDAPEEQVPQLRDGYEEPILEELDLKSGWVKTIIWATGYSRDYSLVKLPVLDDNGFPIQESGVTRHPGLFFVGMPWMPTFKPAILAGVGEAAQHIARAISERRSS